MYPLHKIQYMFYVMLGRKILVMILILEQIFEVAHHYIMQYSRMKSELSTYFWKAGQIRSGQMSMVEHLLIMRVVKKYKIDVLEFFVVF